MASKATGPASDDVFVYASPAGKITIGAFSKVPKTFPIMEAVEDNDNFALMVLAVRAQASADNIGRIRKLSAEELDAFVEAWTAWSGVGPGESPAS